MKKKKIKTVINKQKIFIFISFIFLLVCVLWYGGRAIYFYLDSRKTIENEDKLLAQTIIDKNYGTDNFKKINGDNYFYNNAKTNYLTYSNILWRIIKVTKDNEIVLISENPLTVLAYGENKNLKSSYITKWLNDKNTDDSGILEKNLNNVDNYLMKTKTCTDDVKNIKNISCKKTNNDNYLSLLSVMDYINTGSDESFINNRNYTYLANTDNKNNAWYMNEDGKLDTTDGTDVYGVKAVITIKPTVSLVSGDGTEGSPYKIEDKNSYFASYVKLGEDIYRVYDTQNDILKLSLNNYLTVDNEPLEYIYSNNDYYHNDTIYGSLAYYLNNRYLSSLSYQDSVLNNKYPNIIYGTDSEFDYGNINVNTIDTKVYMLSIGDVMLNDLDNYFLATGTNDTDNSVYIKLKSGTVDMIDVTDEANVVPCISIDKSILKQGSGTLDDPYRME